VVLVTFFVCLVQLCVFVILLGGSKHLSKLDDHQFDEKVWPSLSIVVPARNEEDTIELGLSSLAELKYPRLEIIVVNDRSTDKTLQKIERLREQFPQIKVKNVTDLPNGWLGKNYALQKGSEESKSELILFTDADVEITTDFLRKALAFFRLESLDHLGGIPKVTSRTWYLYPLIGVFGLGFSLFTRPWQGKDPKKDRAVGIGAFNLVRRKAYEAIGGHRLLALRPDDDLKLALIMKRHGFKTDCVNGVCGMKVEWYPDFVSLLKGLEKNVMTGFEYRFVLAALGLVAFAGVFIFPFVLLVITKGMAFVLALISVMFLMSSYFGQLYLAGLPLWCVPFMPLAGPIILVVFTRACLLTYLRKGVYWRETFYSLDELRSNRMSLPGQL